MNNAKKKRCPVRSGGSWTLGREIIAFEKYDSERNLSLLFIYMYICINSVVCVHNYDKYYLFCYHYMSYTAKKVV